MILDPCTKPAPLTAICTLPCVVVAVFGCTIERVRRFDVVPASGLIGVGDVGAVGPGEVPASPVRFVDVGAPPSSLPFTSFSELPVGVLLPQPTSAAIGVAVIASA